MWLILLALVFSQKELDSAFDRLSDARQIMIKSLSTEIEPTKSARIQYLLFREHLVWQNFDNTTWWYKRQVTIIIMLSFHKAIGLFEKQIEDIKTPDDKQAEWIRVTRQFIEEAKKLIKKDFRELGEITDRDLDFPST